MLEKEIQMRFIKEWHDNLSELFNNKLRLYSFEFPVRTPDGIKKADLVYEINKSNPMDNRMLVIELKKDKIDTGVCDQVSRYAYYIQKQLYRKYPVKSIIAGPDFSDWEIKTCIENNIHALQYDLKGNMRLIV